MIRRAAVALLVASTGCGDDGVATDDAASDPTTTSTTTTTEGMTTSAQTTMDPTTQGADDNSSEVTGNETSDPETTGGESGYAGNIIIPELITGTEFNLVMAEGSHTFVEGGSPSDTAGYNGGFLGPTMEWRRGDEISISVTNNLSSATTTHWHGAHVSPANDGGPHQMIGVGETWTPAFEVMNVASTMWYHPHLHEDTADQVRIGLSGFIIVRDDVEDSLDLPREYGVDDLPLVLQDKQLDNNGVLQGAPDRGNTMTVNGAAEAFREVPGQRVRLRLLNGSLEYTYNLEFDDGRTFHVIGTDLGLLEAPVEMTSLMISPGLRYEIVVDFTADEGESVTLESINTELPMGVIGGMPGMPGMQTIEGTDFDVIRFDVVEATENPAPELPDALVTPSIPEEKGATPREMVMANAEPPAMGFTLNGEIMDHHVINEYVQEDAIEIWTLTNTTGVAHPFHIHDIHFHVLDRDPDGDGPMDPVPPQAWEAGPKDTVLVLPGESLRFIGQFTDFAVDPAAKGGIADAAYMYHCHILPHEDDGMMGQFAVCPSDAVGCPPT